MLSSSSQPQPDSAPAFNPWPAIGDGPISLGAMPQPDRRRAEAAPLAPPIAHSQQYLLYLAEIGENTSLLVHDMRSPLTVILNGLRLCHRMPLPQIARQRLALALEEAERLNRMVNDVITFARTAHPSEGHWSTDNPARGQRRSGQPYRPDRSD